MKQSNFEIQTKKTKVVKATSKKLSIQVTEFTMRIIFKDEQNDQNHEKILLLDNEIDDSIMYFYRNIERVVSMSHL